MDRGRWTVGLKNHWVECDSYDREAFDALKAGSPSLQALEQSGGKLLPHFDGFLLDLFAMFFKLNLVLHAEEEVLPSAALYRLLIEHIRAVPALGHVRQHTALEETVAGLAALILGERLLEVLKSERLLTRAEMLDVWNLRHQEEEIAVRAEEMETAEMLRRRVSGRAAERQLFELHNRLQRESDGARRRLQQQAQRLREAFSTVAERQHNRLHAQLDETLRELEQFREDADSWSAHVGGGWRSSPAAQIELGHRLARNPKIKRMAQLVGRMRESARALRQKIYERRDEEIFDVGLGAELSHLLPPELLGLGHAILRRDVRRRFLERELLVYDLRRHEKGRGPMVVCLDGSSSMAGDKEIWSKAVTLTLLDIARRQRRRFRCISFSSADTPLRVHELNPGQAYDADMRQMFEIAEHFPGGGTDFRTPLDAAVESLRRSPRKEGDIVLITDGECRIEPEWLQSFKRAKDSLGFTLFSVLIDVGPSSLGALRELSDKVTSVTQLTTDASRDIFLKL